MDLNFLVSSAGRRGELVNILRQTIALLGRTGGVYCIDRSPLSAAGQMADGFDLVPSVEDPTFVDAVLSVCATRRISHVIPTIDTELPVYAENRDIFERAGVHVWVSKPEVVRIAQDKRLTNGWLTSHGFPTPKQRDLAAAMESPPLAYPVIAKPSRGSSSVGLAMIQNSASLSALDVTLDYVLEEVASGHEFTVDAWVDDHGVCRAAVPRRRLETRAGEVSKGMTVRDDKLIEIATEVASSLPGARGVLNVQIFHDHERGTQHVIEINARFGGGFPLSWAAGAHMPAWGVSDFEGDPPEQLALDHWKPGVLMLRFDQGIYVAPSESNA